MSCPASFRARNQWPTRSALLCTLTCCIGFDNFAPAQSQGIDPDTQAAIVTKVGAMLAEHYVFPDVATRCAAQLRTRIDGGSYAQAADPAAFATTLTKTLVAISTDQHLLVRVRAPATPNAGGHELQPLHPLHERMRRRSSNRERNYGFEKIEHLADNIGYLDLRYFASPWDAQPTAVAAMRLLSNCDALIFDMRQNGGGSPGMVQFLCSYLFVERTHLNSLYFREGDRTQEFWTHDVPGMRLPDVPVFVLTSSTTFSGAEEFCYNLRTQKRATLVGETTRGGANPGNLFAINEQLEIFIPTGRAINPVTNSNWEGTGVTPHVAVAATEALPAALELARPAAKQYREAHLAKVAAVQTAHQAALQLDDDHQAAAAAKVLGDGLTAGHAAGLFQEEDVNQLGYELLGQKRYALAIAALQCNVASFPASSNAHDSLGEAQRAAGQFQAAIASYEQALRLAPDGPNATAARAVLIELQKAVLLPDAKQPQPTGPGGR